MPLEVNDTRELILNPVPSILIESLRDIGYSFETALADIVDNSLSANATEINIEARVSPAPVVAVVDDGEGLTREELLDSMRMGSRDPKLERNITDLGRFGLGLKTASFSQCRKLTVASRRDGITTCFSWDLDLVVEQNEWRVQEIAETGDLPFIEMLGQQGTLVIWEKLDRVCGNEDDLEKIEQLFNRHIDLAEKHLSLVFHRFLGHERGYKQVKMSLNGGRISPLDPFVTRHPATIHGPIEPLAEGVTVQSFTLPHASKYKRKSDYERNGLSGGYIKSQGIYLYRSRRLIIYGTWFGLTKKSTLTQLCRVKIDIDNSHDEDWKIDVKKASAQLPESVRTEIRNLISSFKAPSVRVYKRRGATQASKELDSVWVDHRSGMSVSFNINREHPVIREYLNDLDEGGRKSFELVLKLLESAFPKDSMFIELEKQPENVVAPVLEPNDFADIVRRTYEMYRIDGKEDRQIYDILSSIEMFKNRWAEVLETLGVEEK